MSEALGVAGLSAEARRRVPIRGRKIGQSMAGFSEVRRKRRTLIGWDISETIYKDTISLVTGYRAPAPSFPV